MRRDAFNLGVFFGLLAVVISAAFVWPWTPADVSLPDLPAIEEEAEAHIGGGCCFTTFPGHEHADYATGHSGASLLHGKGGNDRLYGALGDDYLVGHAGNDVLVGGDGYDYCKGGRGADTFVGCEVIVRN